MFSRGQGQDQELLAGWDFAESKMKLLQETGIQAGPKC
jgi:hypothetical protein